MANNQLNKEITLKSGEKVILSDLLEEMKDKEAAKTIQILSQRFDNNDQSQTINDQELKKISQIAECLSLKGVYKGHSFKDLEDNDQKNGQILEGLGEKFGIECTIDAHEIIDQRPIFEYIEEQKLSDKIITPNNIVNIFDKFFPDNYLTEEQYDNMINQEPQTKKWIVRKIKKFTRFTQKDKENPTGQPICMQIPPTFTTEGWQFFELKNEQLISRQFKDGEEVPLSLTNLNLLLKKAHKDNNFVVPMESFEDGDLFHYYVEPEIAGSTSSWKFKIFTSGFLENTANKSIHTMLHKRNELFENGNHEAKWDTVIAIIFYQLYTLLNSWKWVKLLWHWPSPDNQRWILDLSTKEWLFLTIGTYTWNHSEYELKQTLGNTWLQYEWLLASYEFNKEDNKKK